MLRSQLVRDEQGRVCMQIDMDGHVATHPLPDGFGKRSDEAQREYFDEVVPAMMRKLIEAKNKERTKINRKAAD